MYKSYMTEDEQEEGPSKWFVKQLNQLPEKLEALHKTPLPMTHVDEAAFKAATTCHICGQSYSEKDVKVRDHCHLTGRYVLYLIINLNIFNVLIIVIYFLF